MKRVKTVKDKEYSNFIQNLIAERQRLGLSQLEVASQIGMSQSEISKIENLERRLDILELKKLLQVYRITSNQKLANILFNFFEITNLNG